jgi:hypothetical protein
LAQTAGVAATPVGAGTQRHKVHLDKRAHRLGGNIVDHDVGR